MGLLIKFQITVCAETNDVKYEELSCGLIRRVTVLRSVGIQGDLNYEMVYCELDSKL